MSNIVESPLSAATQAAEALREHGTVSIYWITKGYGFLVAQDRTSLYFHVREIQGTKVPNRGDHVSFRRIKDRKDRDKATDVKIEMIENISNT